MKLTMIVTAVQVLSGSVEKVSTNLRKCEGHVFHKTQIAAIMPAQGVTAVDMTYTNTFDIQSVAEGDGGILNVVLADGSTAVFQNTANCKIVVGDEPSEEEGGPEEEVEAAPVARGRQAAPAPVARGRQAAPAQASADDLGDDGFNDLDGGDATDLEEPYDPDADPDLMEEAAPVARGRQAAPAPVARGRQAAPAPVARGRQAAPVADEGFDDFAEEAPAAPVARGRQAAPAPVARGRQAAPAPVARGRQAAPVADDDGFGDF